MREKRMVTSEPEFGSLLTSALESVGRKQLIVVSPQHSAVNWFSGYPLDPHDLYASLLQWRATRDHYLVVRLVSGGDKPYELLYTGQAVDAQFTTARQLALPVPESCGFLDPTMTVVYVISDDPAAFMARLDNEMQSLWPNLPRADAALDVVSTIPPKGSTDA